MRLDMHPIEPEELMAYLDGELEPQRAFCSGPAFVALR